MNRLGIESPRGLVAFAALTGCLVTMAVAALTGAGGVFAAAGLAGCGCELLLHRTAPGLMTRLGRLHMGATSRFEFRCVLLLLLLGRLHVTGPIGLAAAMTLVLCLLAGQALHAALTTLIRRRRALAVAARNIDLRRLDISDRPPRRLTEWPGQRILVYELSALLGLTASLTTGDARWVVAALTLSAGSSLVTVVALVPYLVRAARRLPGAAEVLAEVDAWLIRHRPRTVLYFSGPRDRDDQVTRWLGPVAALPTPSLVILRERELLEALGPTPLPVLCVPSAAHLAQLDLSGVRVALYPANTGRNIHLLRIPTMQHVFLAPGDGDETAAVDPYSKVYDQVWVAGEAGRRRYARAAVGVEEADIVEIGRPQLDGLRVTGTGHAPAPTPTVTPLPTVLYAPTRDLTAGEPIVRALLESERPVRVLYRPHPPTGHRSPEDHAAHRRIAALIQAANERRAAEALAANALGRATFAADALSADALAAEALGGDAVAPDAFGEEPDDARAPDADDPHSDTPRTEARRGEAARLRAELTKRMAALDARLRRADADEAMLTRDRAAPDPALLTEAEGLRREWHQAHWAASPPWLHQVIEGDAPTLHSCFDQADLLIGDPSDVVGDFLATLKPYALTVPEGLGEEEFRRRHVTARAAYPLGPGASGMQNLLRPLFDPSLDELRTARREVKEFLLGPATPLSIQRFTDAVDALAEKGEAVVRLRDLHTASPPGAGRWSITR
ncbi:hypothetical protein [Streptomyces rapamycinicus]|uniref:Aromatic ring-opening dioxygenase LigA n=2 Tax=Streptomyces rapamycinicus TaxID=1226757 RepID=A0A0A0NS39_STRRN|nr:hypothetical protein [Streptomyces rapamycinicus]AGP57395.1 aromatic ring-opening dioxygenase LigA [Streptomyces rapamycinicus NRRL 5491]MBB4785047.1 hypothetical protein [Streptomyces rapamycinicus]RLV79477.1 aromatic ring-opening dioxygenase LigA [Streptomyces rapamycinicus NRRL 5491]UTO65276.1 hypothetical protein LJB45_25105 [Streptomyces rapamycinicus]UTP33232.1 hypothetical protein LIV37_30235 [Streptomyces rapamycinicus NRRL 5491]